MLSDEERKLADELIAADQTMTPAEREACRTAERLDLYRSQLRRQLEGLEKKHPAFLLAMSALNMFNVACSLWPQAMATHLRDEFIERIRLKDHRCQQCNASFPMPFDSGRRLCAGCEADADSLIEKYGGDAP